MIPASKAWGETSLGMMGIKSGWQRNVSELRVKIEWETEME